MNGFSKKTQKTPDHDMALAWSGQKGIYPKASNPQVGFSFDDFLIEDGIYGAFAATAVKLAIAWQLEQSRLAQDISTSAFARQMYTSRTRIDRLLDPTDMQGQLDTLRRAAKARERTLVIKLK
jgi:hypothetical protein